MRQWLNRLRHPLAVLFLAIPISGLYCASQGGCHLLTPEQKGYRAFQSANYAVAGRQFSDPRWRAAALFRQGEFKQAAGIFAGFDTAEGAFNHGNALVMQGLYEDAVARYSRALELKPGWQEALRNREIAMSRARNLEREGADMTGGKLGADEIEFTAAKPPPTSGDEQAEQVRGMAGDAELRSIWLRQVQTRPADFLRSKFAHQRAMRQATGE
jgi:Ca-activated chloride channel family protein